jgi:GPH family glycoside/pentoside/hexuronide:cation symporter
VQLVIITQNAQSNFTGVLVLCVLAGVGVSAAHVLPWSIMPDAIEWGELQSGERHEGMFYSLVTLAQKVASSIAIPLSLLLLEATGYIPNVIEQPASAALGIRLVVGPIPAVLLCAGILFAWLYPLGRDEFNRLNRDLRARRGENAEGGEAR